MWHHKGHSGKINSSFRYLLGLEGRALMDSYPSGFLQLSIRGHSVHSTERLACVRAHTPISHLASFPVQKYCSSNPQLWTQWELSSFHNVDSWIKINLGGKKVPCARQADSLLLWRHTDEQSLASGAVPQGTVRQSALGWKKREFEIITFFFGLDVWVLESFVAINLKLCCSY